MPGDMIAGQGNMAQNEVVVNIDDYLTAAADVYDLDDAKAHYDIRSIYKHRIGQGHGPCL